MVKHANPRATRQLHITLLLFFGLAVVALLGLYLADPTLYVRMLLLTPRPGDSHPVIVTVFLGGILLFVSVLSVGVLRCWRWLFWGLLIANGLSVLDIPGTFLAVSGVLPLTMPLWYGLLRIGVSVVQVAIAVWMFRLYQQHGVWASGAPARRP